MAADPNVYAGWRATPLGAVTERIALKSIVLIGFSFSFDRLSFGKLISPALKQQAASSAIRAWAG
jgi:hypothetical protein